MLYNAALVLEGGAFRGQYTAGIVDTFLAHHIEFRSVIGVSAGSLCGVNFVSKQYGRAANININHRHDRNYISMARVFKKQIINLDYETLCFKCHFLSCVSVHPRRMCG